ncbi:MAG: metallophosphoesterase, partial [Deltaproteobacteria bacterium]|nr:metallophosphoesterase [Deltaproteobacteria bacterium]
MNRLGLVPWALVGVFASVAEARPIEFRVFDDVNGDGKQGNDEPGVPAIVSYSGMPLFVPTDADGRVTLEVENGIAWVRVPSGFRPGPVWAQLDGKSRIDFALRRWAPPPGPLTFVATSDSHSSFAHPFWSDLEPAAYAATRADPPPAFFTILGDLTQNTTPAQFVLQDRLLANLDVTYVPVPGNHDWYDGGKAWRVHYGPDNYSFDIGDVHFVVWNMMMRDEDTKAFFTNELRDVAPEMTVVAMTHGPPSPAVVAKLRELGVDYVLSGHTHTNRVVDHGGMIELNHEPMLMGGLDFTPGGYRIITIDRDVLTSEHRTTVGEPSIRSVAPARRQCQPPGGGAIIAATEIDPRGGTVTARVDCGTPIALSYGGGWSWRGTLPALAPGEHSLTLDAITSDGERLSSTTGIEVCSAETGTLAGIEWPQLGGNSAHT